MLSNLIIKVPARETQLHIKRKNASKINVFAVIQNYWDRRWAKQRRHPYP